MASIDVVLTEDEFNLWLDQEFGPVPTPQWVLLHLQDAARLEIQRDAARRAWRQLRLVALERSNPR